MYDWSFSYSIVSFSILLSVIFEYIGLSFAILPPMLIPPSKVQKLILIPSEITMTQTINMNDTIITNGMNNIFNGHEAAPVNQIQISYFYE
ncbi:hypothetical protein PGB90_002360 [Kerria lacca]